MGDYKSKINEIALQVSNRNLQARIEKLKQLNSLAVPDSITLIGDSMAEFFPTDELLREYRIYNRGVGGDTSAQMLERLPYTAEATHSKNVLIEIGTNDLSNYRTTEQTIETLKCLCERLKGVKITVLSVFPINDVDTKNNPETAFLLAGRDNEKIRRLNTAIEKFCTENGIAFIDVFDKFLDERGVLKKDYTAEGLHLSVKGYCVLCNLLKEYFEKANCRI